MNIDESVARLMQGYRDRYGGEELPVPVDSIAEDFLGLALREAGDLEVSGMLIPDQKLIWLNATESRRSPARRRFTIGHEIGHWICHSKSESSQRFCRDVGVARGKGIEREANAFAAELLMPRELVVRDAIASSQRADPRLQSDRAYMLVALLVYRRMPPCRDCGRIYEP